jgi:IS605 OrfB family transposase
MIGSLIRSSVFRNLGVQAGDEKAVSRQAHSLLDYENEISDTLGMKLTLQLQLLPTAEQKAALLDTMARFNAAATYAVQVGFAAGVFGQVSIHHLAYTEIRARFGLSSQMAVRAIAKAVECFQRDKIVCPTFKPHSAMCYDQRVLSFRGLTEVSLWALTGRLRMPFVCGVYQHARQGRIQGQADLVTRQGKLYLLCTIDMPDAAPITLCDILGVDLGVVNLATTSDGTTHSGKQIDTCRTRYARRRQQLQRAAHLAQMEGKRPKNIRRALQRMAHHEAGFRRDVNHRISKKLVADAKGTDRGIALEDLQDMRGRTRFRRQQRARMSGWAFAQLRSFIEYKARLAGVPVIVVNPWHTSQGCNVCGHIARRNRPSQAHFSCRRCGYTTNADFNAALNIRSRALVNAPIVAVRPWQLVLPLAKPATSSVL